MDTNKVNDAIYDFLKTKHTRVYRNRAPQSPVFPYIVFKVDTVVNTYPSFDMYLNINVFEDVNTSIRSIETLADEIDDALEQNVISDDEMSLRFGLEQRQTVGSEDLIDAQLVNLRYVVRGYFEK
ncbi:MAG: hypothetical protein M0P10_06895 [Sphaerochaetaceae bacterium]|nr:hypothetical protein [Sphaerochaetaceae bacterium]